MYNFMVRGVVFYSFTEKEARVAVEMAREWTKPGGDFPHGVLRYYDGKGGMDVVDLKRLPRKPARKSPVTVKKIAKKMIGV